MWTAVALPSWAARPLSNEPVVLVSVSVPQEKRRVLASQRSFEVSAVSQSVRPAPKSLEEEAKPNVSRLPEILALAPRSVLPVTFKVELRVVAPATPKVEPKVAAPEILAVP